ncbi:hypothetical protein EFP01_188 [Enterococcus phage EFP01]|uniref:Uncharacterized protein n=1 Tax=Enterococcus phage EFP01 TaxID=1926594 RepID=A0A288TZT8_9CAUD|nr:hypothetical protein HOR47_gp188 [Enterococcus phage EFP01]APZ82115.1 hypothetical protein EFP01_188 [Enterococcus phage EFP01]
MEKQFNQKHMLKATEWRSEGYLDTTQINQEQSYFIQSRPTSYGSHYVYQYVTMNDGTVYELYSTTASTRGIVANTCKAKDVLQREVKQYRDNAIYY